MQYNIYFVHISTYRFPQLSHILSYYISNRLSNDTGCISLHHQGACEQIYHTGIILLYFDNVVNNDFLLAAK